MSEIPGKGKSAKVNGYKAFYKGKSIDVWAESSFSAQTEAAKIFKAKRAYEVSVVLCEKDGEAVIHTPL